MSIRSRIAAALLIAALAAPALADGISNPGGTVTQSAVTSAGGVVKLGQQTLPMVLVSSGTMGNNGALSGLTAVATAYPNAYCFLPAGAISAGSAAGWYYCTFSSTTAATVFNNTYTSGTPAIPASPTPFATTGPGAYTQTTASNIAAYTLSIPGNMIGLNGGIWVQGTRTHNNSAGAKTLTLNYDTYAPQTQTATTTITAGFLGGFTNRGVANVQVPLSITTFNGFGSNTTALTYGVIDSTATKNLIFNMQLATATDTMTLESAVVELMPSVP